MEPWQTLREAIPDRMLVEVARHMHVSRDYVSRWRREPLSDEAPAGTGMASPLSRTLDLINGVFTVNPNGPSLIVEHVVLHWEMITRAHGIKSFNSSNDRAIASADLLTRATVAVNSLNVDGITEETLRNLSALRDAVDAVVSRVGKDLFHKPQLSTKELEIR